MVLDPQVGQDGFMRYPTLCLWNRKWCHGLVCAVTHRVSATISLARARSIASGGAGTKARAGPPRVRMPCHDPPAYSQISTMSPS